MLMFADYASQDAQSESRAEADHAQHHRRCIGSTRYVSILNITISSNITGYWMPYDCALAVCTTFCAHIAGALIPIFGPDFPSKCVQPEAPEHGRMIIDSQIVQDATKEAENYRQIYNTSTPRSTPRNSMSPQLSRPEHSPDLHRTLRLKRAFHCDSPYSGKSDTEMATGSETSGDDYLCSPGTSSVDWHSPKSVSHSKSSSLNTPRRIISANPWLSAIPRSTGMADLAAISNKLRAKRRVDEVDDAYDGEESMSVADDKSMTSDKEESSSSIGEAEKRAAYVLMQLSVHDAEQRQKKELGGPRLVKRLRATSA